MSYVGRLHARTILRLGHPSYCHCQRCWQPNRVWRVVGVVGPWIAFAAVLYVLGHLCIWAIGLQWAMRIGN